MGRRQWINLKKILRLLIIPVLLVGCESTDKRKAEIFRRGEAFKLPQTPSKDKALVYIICPRTFLKDPIEKIAFFYRPISQKEYQTSQSFLAKLAKSFSTPSKKSFLEGTLIGYLAPAEYRSIQLDPGYYELSFNPFNIKSSILKGHTFYRLKLSPGGVYFVHTYLRYIQRSNYDIEGYIDLKMAEDDRMGKFILSQNFNKPYK